MSAAACVPNNINVVFWLMNLWKSILYFCYSYTMFFSIHHPVFDTSWHPWSLLSKSYIGQQTLFKLKTARPRCCLQVIRLDLFFWLCQPICVHWWRDFPMLEQLCLHRSLNLLQHLPVVHFVVLLYRSAGSKSSHFDALCVTLDLTLLLCTTLPQRPDWDASEEIRLGALARCDYHRHLDCSLN